MKKTLLILAVLTAAGLAFGATQYTRMMNLSVLGKSMLGTTTETNAITRSLYGTITFDFASKTITCEDSTTVAVVGALVGDPCFVGMPATLTGAGTGLHGSYSCYVDVADSVKVRHCTSGTADNPGSVTFKVRVISGQ